MGYWQVPLRREDCEKTAFLTKDGLFQFVTLPFGLNNAGATFGRLMEHVLRGYQWKRCLIYLDDILTFGALLMKHCSIWSWCSIGSMVPSWSSSQRNATWCKSHWFSLGIGSPARAYKPCHPRLIQWRTGPVLALCQSPSGELNARNSWGSWPTIVDSSKGWAP